MVYRNIAGFKTGNSEIDGFRKSSLRILVEKYINKSTMLICKANVYKFIGTAKCHIRRS